MRSLRQENDIIFLSNDWLNFFLIFQKKEEIDIYIDKMVNHGITSHKGKKFMNFGKKT